MKTAFITGITGQDGSFLAEYLLEQGYMVYGMIRRASGFNTSRIEHIYKDIHEDSKLKLVYGDLTDAPMLYQFFAEHEVHEVYNLAAQSHVRTSFEIPQYTIQANLCGFLNLLEAIRNSRQHPRIYQASTSEMYGNIGGEQDETTPFNPVSPYGVSKVGCYNLSQIYNASYDMRIYNGILFNHESERRGETFVTRKITRAATRIAHGIQKHLYLGNLSAMRDWGYAPEYVRAMHLILQQDTPCNVVVGSGHCHAIHEFAQKVFNYLGLDSYERYIKVDKKYFRPKELKCLKANPKKIFSLGWEPKVDIDGLVKIMCDHDLELARNEAIHANTCLCAQTREILRSPSLN